jgi:hypothetical protein
LHTSKQEDSHICATPHCPPHFLIPAAFFVSAEA